MADDLSVGGMVRLFADKGGAQNGGFCAFFC